MQDNEYKSIVADMLQIEPGENTEKKKLLCHVTLMFKIIFGEQGCVIL